MKIIDLTALSIKIAGIVLFVIVLSKVPDYVQFFYTAEKNQYTVSELYLALPIVIVAAACIGLFLFPYKLSNKLIVTPDTTDQSHISNAYQTIGIRILGLLLLFWSVSDMVFTLFNYLMLRDPSETLVSVSTVSYPYVIATTVEILFAIFLLRYSSKISAYINEINR
jgi:formate hydrogenlyase subunit 3/multisubunit Na+/H+ antiporter MnhD subunit